MPAKDLKLTFTLNKEHKILVAYLCNIDGGEKPPINSLYIRKDALPQPLPNEITVELLFSEKGKKGKAA